MGWQRESSPLLPPQSAWLVDVYDPRNRVESAVDYRNVVQPDTTNEAVLGMLDPSYLGSRKPNLNHYVFPEHDYKGRQIGKLALVRYRNLTPLTRYLPADIHNLFTLVVEEPPMPEPEVMSYMIEAWQVAHNLFEKAKDIKEAQQMFGKRLNDIAKGYVTRKDDDRINMEYLRSEYKRQFRLFDYFVEDYATLPDEFKPTEIDVSLKPNQLATNVVKQLGRYLTPQVVRPPAAIAA
jgi:hypothetical protein